MDFNKRIRVHILFYLVSAQVAILLLNLHYKDLKFYISVGLIGRNSMMVQPQGGLLLQILIPVIYSIFQIPASILDKDNYHNFLLNGLTTGLIAEYSHTNILLHRSYR
jgi:hypothetical protein